MKKIERLKKILKLIKLQEQDVLAEFKETQKISNALKMQIDDLTNHSKTTSTKLLHQQVTVNELMLVKSFNSKVEIVLEQLNHKLLENEKKFLQVAENIKELRSKIKSIERLADRHTQIHDYEYQRAMQREIEENINYTLIARE